MAFWNLQDPQFSVRNLQDDVNRLMQRVWHAGVSMGPFDGQEWAPHVDLYEHENNYTLHVEIPGVDPNTVDVSYSGSTLTLRGNKQAPVGDDEHTRQLRRERQFGAFCRTIELPSDIEADRLTAKCRSGVLEITIPRSASNRPRPIKIEVEDG